MVFFFTSLVFLGVGLLRMELAALFWGGFFLSLVILGWLSVFLSWRGLKKHHADPLDGVETSPSPVTEGQELVFPYRFTLPPLPWPAVRLRVEIFWTFLSRRSGRTQAPLEPGLNQGRMTLTLPRGVYLAQGPEMILGDWWGLAQGRLTLPAPGKAVVHPAAWTEEPPELPPSGTGEHRSRSPRRQRNSELLEVRKYYPGDDLRRINWHQFAHSGELFLRIGEENPPPEAQICLVFDDSATGLDLSPGSELEVLDRRIGQFVGLCQELLAQGWGVLVALPGHSTLLDWGAAPQETLDALAALLPAASAQPLPPLPGLRGLVVTFPGSMLEGSYKDAWENQGLGGSTLTLTPPLPSPSVPLPWWKRPDPDHRTRQKDLGFLARRFQEAAQ